MNSTYTILYVDDDTDDLLLISEAFEKYTGHLRVVHAHNGLEAMQVLKRMHNKGFHPCLVILDINMPIMNGKETLKEIRATEGYEQIPVVMFSTSRSDTDKSFAAVQCFLYKQASPIPGDGKTSKAVCGSMQP